ncbi:alpha/beta-hydrolase [Lindgomyces ingoldianus]|uniref:Alpha/beta-hydrolase n=1 Tax=Lindgomyces ingoldianus TaxID=673940 RepID=A0ACB6RFV2_9PLEO|nr:alpha/beta-hydrolase [Lindgomyces ingoldianus]KAF2478234.1 alpha/beta-hydrolase [Lindgomyces ingoldianus]
MAQFGFLTYLRLKLTVTLIRMIARVIAFSSRRRDKAIADEIDVQRRRVAIPSRDRGRFIDADFYYPPGHSASSLATSKKPVLVNWHGSGFIIPMLGSDMLFCSRMARDMGIIVIDADYRKAPETPFPAAIQDVEDTLIWIAAQPGRFDLSRIAVSGFSAGANLALVAASAVKKTLLDLTVPVVIAIYPVTDFTIAPDARAVPKPKSPLPPFMFRLFNDCYTPDVVSRKDPRVSPSKADTADFPPTVAILTCEGDTLMPEARDLANRLDDGKRKVVNLTLEDAHHGFDKGCKKGTHDWDLREEAYGLSVKTLREALGL